MVETTDLRYCPRCRASHPELGIRKFLRPVLTRWTWWGICPATGEPVVLTDLMWDDAEIWWGLHGLRGYW